MGKTIPKYLASFSGRQGRAFTDTQLEALRAALSRREIVLEGGLDVHALFGNKREYWLEIGFGGGEHALHQARSNPDVGMMASEVFMQGVYRLVRDADAAGVENLKLFTKDARLLLDALPDAALSRAFILFPDPWPKHRHQKRRIVSQETLNLLQKKIKPGGRLRLATDFVDYARWMLAQVLMHGGFQLEAQDVQCFYDSPADHITTRYEQKARDYGTPPFFMDCIRNS